LSTIVTTSLAAKLVLFLWQIDAKVYPKNFAENDLTRLLVPSPHSWKTGWEYIV